MKLIRKINNNFAYALDSNGEPIIVEGKGIGFVAMPCEFNDLSKISRTYYNYNEQYVELLNQIPKEVMDVSNEIYLYLLDNTSKRINPNLPFTLADHIYFCIKRLTENIMVDLPGQQDLIQLYPEEYETAVYAINLIKDRLKISLPRTEIPGIVLNIINSEADIKKTKEIRVEQKIQEDVVNIIERKMNIEISYDSYNFARFQTHLKYLLQRVNKNQKTDSDNQKMYESLASSFPETSECVDEIAEYLKKNMHMMLPNEEKLYLILHVNRLCTHELGL